MLAEVDLPGTNIDGVASRPIFSPVDALPTYAASSIIVETIWRWTENIHEYIVGSRKSGAVEISVCGRASSGCFVSMRYGNGFWNPRYGLLSPPTGENRMERVAQGGFDPGCVGRSGSVMP